MPKFKSIPQNTLFDITVNHNCEAIAAPFAIDPTKHGIGELTEMYNGFFPKQNIIKTDNGSFVDLLKVKSIYCVLKGVYPSAANHPINSYSISKIQRFHVGKYVLVAENLDGSGTVEYEITQRLSSWGAFNKGTGVYDRFYSIKNAYGTLQRFERGTYPKDLYKPIKEYINGLFFRDDYRIRDFYVASDIQISA